MQVQTVPSSPSVRARTEVPVQTWNVQVQTDVHRRRWYNVPSLSPPRLRPARSGVYLGPDYYQRFDCSFLNFFTNVPFFDDRCFNPASR